MTILHWTLTAVNLVTVAVIGYYLKNFLPTYFTKKAENLATKEDIAEITQRVEKAKSEYSERLESLKARLDKGRHAHQRQYDLELDVYKSLWKELVALREATASLRPLMDVTLGAGETEEQRKLERGKVFFAAFTPLGKTIEENRPFYAPDVWQKVHALRELAWSEALDYRFADHRRNWEKYWGQAEKNSNAIKKLSDDICEAIRSRISHLNE